jgi:hypothetical protein
MSEQGSLSRHPDNGQQITVPIKKTLRAITILGRAPHDERFSMVPSSRWNAIGPGGSTIPAPRTLRKE